MNKVNLVVVVADVVVESEVAEDADPAAELHVIRDYRVVHLAPDAVQKYVDPALNKYQWGLQNRRERQLLHGVPPSQWICLRLPSCRPGFKYQACYLRFFIYSICAIFVLYLSCEKNENEQKEAGSSPFFLKKLLQRGPNSPVDYAVLATTSKALIIRSIPGLDPQ